MAGRDRAGQCDLLAPLGVHRVSIFLMIYAPMALCPSDRPERRTEPRRPANVAGVVVAVGSHVTRFKPGDAIFACVFDLGIGTLAEFAVMPEHAAAPKPDRPH